MAKVNTDVVSLGVPRLRILREAAFWILTGFSLILLVALMSYRPEDPAFSSSGTSDVVLNLVGPWGASFADIAFLLFGLSAYLVPVLVLLAGLLLFPAYGFFPFLIGYTLWGLLRSVFLGLLERLPERDPLLDAPEASDGAVEPRDLDYHELTREPNLDDWKENTS